MKVGDAFKQLRPVLPDLVTPGKGSSGMRRLLTSVVVVEAGKLCLEMMGVHSLGQPLADRSGVVLNCSAHRYLLRAPATSVGIGSSG